jgi:signal transduction histidine kinase
MGSLSPSYLSLADLFEKLEKPDSVLHYATAAYTIGKEMNNASLLRSSSEKIARAWKGLGNPDSALSYIYLSKNIGDSLDKEKTDNLILFQNTAFEEQLKLEKQAQESIQYKSKIRTIGLSSGLAILSLLAFIFYRNNRQKHKANTVLQKAFSDLKATQAQLIQSEKMASLGELTAGIAHEIQNPLNFVNNFSELNKELLTELKDEMRKGNLDEANAIANDVISNEEKINYHGKRADAIVKGMLQHSRNSTGKKERTDINALCDEYLRLAYHGLRAKEKSFNASFESHLDDKIGLVNVVPQDIGRVVLNLLNNAFYAVNERQKMEGIGYVPLVKVSSSKQDDRVVISVADNGTGIPDKVKEKIFQPFFTTKPTGQGTGLGLSMSYDIITKGHGGELLVQSREGEGTEFIIKLPIDRANP